MALELAFDDYDLLADKLIAHQSIQVCNTSFLAMLEEVFTQKLCVAAVLNEDAIRLREFFVPEEEIVSVAVLDGSD